MVLFRITNAILGVMATLWWLFNRQSDMAEPIVALIGCSIVFVEIVGEVIASKSTSYQQSQELLESEVLPGVLDRIEREEGNIQQVIDGKRKKDKIIEEYPIELIAPHIAKLKQIRQFSRLAKRLQAQLDRNKSLPAGEKRFEELQIVLCEIQSLAGSPRSGRRNWYCGLYLVVAVCVGGYGTAVVRLPLDAGTASPSEEQPDLDERPVDSDAAHGAE